MKTPIYDFVRRYADSGAMRLHMPGHKGAGDIERYDITEINGADSLYEAEGIIAESEKNASEIFDCSTFYSTEGSSHCIRAMLYLAGLRAAEQGKKLKVLALRNAHKTFLSAAALLEFQVCWVYPDESESYLSCSITAEKLEAELDKYSDAVTAVYVTSPDYLGNIADIKAIAEVCRKYGVLLLVDNAHGAYLRFLSPSLHPIDLGADICCDSAHKTLPVLTGGAYLHVADNKLVKYTKNALALFGSTSPSYLILQSLDKANEYLAADYPERLKKLCVEINQLKEDLHKKGYTVVGNEPTKVTIAAKTYGYTGIELADILRQKGIECEFADPDYLVLMLTPEISEAIPYIKEVLVNIGKKEPILVSPPSFANAEAVVSVREAMLSPSETVDVGDSIDRILAAATVGCPPAVPIVVSGEKINSRCIECFEYYGIKKCVVMKKSPF